MDRRAAWIKAFRGLKQNPENTPEIHTRTKNNEGSRCNCSHQGTNVPKITVKPPSRELFNELHKHTAALRQPTVNIAHGLEYMGRVANGKPFALAAIAMAFFPKKSPLEALQQLENSMLELVDLHNQWRAQFVELTSDLMTEWKPRLDAANARVLAIGDEIKRVSLERDSCVKGLLERRKSLKDGGLTDKQVDDLVPLPDHHAVVEQLRSLIQERAALIEKINRHAGDELSEFDA